MQLRLGVRGRLFGVSLVLMLAGGSVTAAFLEVKLRGWLRERLDDELLRHAKAAQQTLKHFRGPTTISEIDPLADGLGQAIGNRVTIIAADGRVLGDSALSLARVRAMQSHDNRPEVRQALAEGVGRARRHSDTVKLDMSYVALAHGEGRRGVVRVAMPLHEVGPLVAWLRVMVVIAALLGLAVAVLIGGLASHLMTRTLRQLVARARGLGARRSNPPRPPADEIGLLAGSFNQLTEELESSVAALARERNRLETVLEGMSEALLTLDAEQRVVLANPAARDLLHLGADAPGQPLSALVDQPALHQLVREGAAASAAGELQLPGPPARRVACRAQPLRATGGTVVVLHDVTEMRRLETIRQDFVANVSHELRTPVSVIRANAETLLHGALEDPGRARGFIEALDRSADRLSNIIADLLELARIESGRYDLSLSPLEVDARAAAAVEQMSTTAERKGLSVALEVPAGLAVRADRKALDLVLHNLVDNAVKYTADDGRITISAAEVGDQVRVEVRDDGPGIPAEHRSRIFERFYRVDPGRSRDMGGTGLGLAIVVHLVEAMDGSIGYEPAEPHGSVFWITLPAS